MDIFPNIICFSIAYFLEKLSIKTIILNIRKKIKYFENFSKFIFFVFNKKIVNEKAK